jgi:heme/copper-type cytochrome/quinol oxidase subunit 1
VPRLSVWCIRIALLYLGVGFTLGAVMLSSPAIRLASLIPKLRPLHAEILLIGWLAQLAFGVAYWILPRLPGIRSRGSEPLAWLSLTLLNVGILAVGLGPTVNAPATVTIFGRLTEALAVCAFAIHAWPRARTYSSYRSSTS